MQRGSFRVRNEYRHNRDFRKYVDKYCEKHGYSVEQALEHEQVRQAFLYHTEV